MPVFTKNKKSILFIHIPKCAGSSFERAMKVDGWSEYFSIRGVGLTDMSWSKVSPQHFHAELLQQCFEPKKFEAIVTIVREPFKRLVSEYFWQLKQGITILEPNSWLDDVFLKYETNKLIYDNHIRPQSEFILPETKIFKLEENGVIDAVNFVRQSCIQQNFFLLNAIGKLLLYKKEKKTRYDQSQIYKFECRKVEIIDFYQIDYMRLGYD